MPVCVVVVSGLTVRIGQIKVPHILPVSTVSVCLCARERQALCCSETTTPVYPPAVCLAPWQLWKWTVSGVSACVRACVCLVAAMVLSSQVFVCLS